MKKLLLTTAIALVLAGPAFAADPVAPAPAPSAPMAEPAGSLDVSGKIGLAGLPPAKAELVRSTMSKMREDSKGSKEQLKALYEQQKALFSAPQFDKQAYLAKSDEINALHQSQAKKRAEAMASLASQLTPEERTQLSGHLGRGGHKMGGGWHHKKDGSEPLNPSSNADGKK
jgi:Spy/CpxP family protein refolding chaperone